MKTLKTVIHPLAIVDILKEFQNINKKKFFGKKIGSLLGYYKKKKNILYICFQNTFSTKNRRKLVF